MWDEDIHNTSVRFTGKNYIKNFQIDGFDYRVSGKHFPGGFELDYKAPDPQDQRIYTFSIVLHAPMNYRDYWRIQSINIYGTDLFVNEVYRKLGIEGLEKGPISDADFKNLYDGFIRLGEEDDYDVLDEDDYELLDGDF